MKRSVMLVLVLAIVQSVTAEDRLKVVKEGQALAKEGKHAEALALFQQVQDNARDPEAGSIQARMAAIDSWKQLGERYTPALEALRKTRDEKTAALENGKDDRNLFLDVKLMNRALQEEGKTLELFRKIDRLHPGLAESYWPMVRQAAWEARAYDVARTHAGNPRRAFAELSSVMEMRGYTEEEKKFARAEMEHGFEMEVQVLIFLALASNDADAAREIQKQALAIVDSPLIREAIPKDRRKDDTAPAARRTKPDPSDPRALVRDLGSQDATLRESAERRLMELPPEVALTAVLEALPERKNGQREAAAFESLALQEMLVRLAPRAMTVLVNALRSGAPDIRRATLYAMGELHALAGEAAPAVGALLRNTERDIAILAASVLWQLGPQSVPVLAKALDEGTPEFRVMIAHCCVASPMGGVSDPAEYAAMIPVLRKALRDRHLQPRLAAASALVWLAPAEASGCVAVLSEGVKSPDEETRSLACGAIQTMARRLEGSKPEEVRALLTAFGRIGPGATDAVPGLTWIARENADAGLRAAAEETLEKIVPKEGPGPERPQELPSSIRIGK